ncbi:protein phosphatase 2C domain-containing protein [Streptomyces sp. ASQP_92]|uniref:protein phosphatase 2C domain-containing protein n=1 Tax=Streptomyces sp. ASQP_92 TaxID=2979116 RepID=UPI0021BF6F2C|nr:protein phosphatase 2C domain-containing protein [Streptomyces sp. ASQP_92]MCT9093388.1 protein phosphatase 2C domain-containing protein [Streptomyces sp. ASQP_92]
MSQQGERPARDDDWWNRLYDESAPDAGPDGSRDSLDDRFNSVSDTVRCPAVVEGPEPTSPPAGRAAPPPDAAPPPHAPPAAAPSAPPPPSPGAAPSAGAAPPNDGAPPPPTAPPPGADRSADPSAAAPAPAPAAPVPQAASPHTGTPGPARPAEPPLAAPAPGRPADSPTAPPPGPTAPEPRPRAPWEPPEGVAEPRKAAAWWESVPAAPPPPAEPAPLPDLPPGWAESESSDAPHPPGARPPVTGTAATSRDADDDPLVTNAPRAPRTPTPDASGPPMTAPDEQFAPSARFESVPRPRTGHVGDGPPTYDAEPTALPTARPEELDDLVADTVLDGARYGTYVLRAVSARGDSARYRGEPRRDALLTARFGTGENALVLVAVASGVRTSDRAQLAAADACHWIGGAIGRSHVRLAEDIRAGRRGDLKSGLHRLTDRSYGMLRARAAELGAEPEEYTANLRCLLLSADPACRTRVFFGVGHGGLFRLRGGVWQDIEPAVPEPGTVLGEPVVGFGSAPAETPAGDRLTMDLGTVEPARPYIDPPAPPGEPFRFRASVARPGDTLLLCSAGLAEPLRGEAALAKELAERWAAAEPPGLAGFLADVQLRVKGYADDRTAVAVWEA